MNSAMIPAGVDTESIWNGRRRAGLGVAFCAFLLAACGSATAVYMGGATLANFIYTDKLPTDYLAELENRTGSMR